MRLLVRCLSIAACVAGLSGVAMAEQVDNPAYAAWAKFKPGTTVTFIEVTEWATQKPGAELPHSVTKTKLVEVKPEGLVIEISSVGEILGRPSPQPANRVDVPAKIEKEKEGIMANGNVEVKDIKEGKEKVDYKGKSVDATTHEKTLVGTKPEVASGSFGTIPVTLNEHIKEWWVEGVPGGMVKDVMENRRPGDEGPPKMTVTATLVDVDIVK